MSLDNLNPDQIAAAAAGSVLRIEVLERVDSTNTVLLGRGLDAHGVALLADVQSAGRGRSGRRWVSPESANLYLSVGWHFPQGAETLAGLSLAVGVAVVDAIAAACGFEAALKWPNDIVYQQRKLGGVLIETTGDRAGGVVAVVGVGINVAMPAAAGDAIDQPWCDLRSLCPEVPARNKLAGSVIVELERVLSTYSEMGFVAWQSRWQALDSLRGCEVRFDGGACPGGIADGVSADGGLRVRVGEQVQIVHAGEAILCKANRGLVQ